MDQAEHEQLMKSHDYCDGRNDGAAAERARLLPVMEQMQRAMKSASGYFGPPTGRIPECAEDAHAQELADALSAYAASLAPSAAREEGKRG